MAAPDYARVAEVVAAAHERQGEARAAYLDTACAGDAALRAEVESLLAHDGGGPPLLATAGAARVLTAGFMAGPDGSGFPEAVGPYRLLGVLGQGGMGTVFRAEQTLPLRREVALKLVRRGLDTDRIIARFAGERQTLALMDHPAIARVLDAGASEDGRPYFVMELVEGRPITELCESRQLGIDERLVLFLAVCAGVQHAHQKGIIHRDLKPSNVLVREQDGRPAPKIIDFGIAKAIEGDAHAATLLTEAGDVVGTPEYMSPEQAGVIEGGVDTRSDVYSLGVMLYELLTGARPRVFATGTVAEIQRVLTHGDPTPPSVAAPTRRQDLAGDLDNIVLKALATVPGDRYGSVEQFADDIRRHRDGLPVRARAATWAYRTGKFVDRHRAGVAAATAAVLLLGGSAVTLGVQATRLAAERDRAVAAEQRARAEAATSAQVTEFLVDVFEVSDPSESRGNSVTVREVLDRGAQQIDSGLAEQPEVRATLQTAIGRVYQNLGLAGVAEALLEAALAGRRAVFGNESAAVGESLDYLARLKRELGTNAEAEALYREALAIKRATLGPAHPSIALTLNNLANALRDRNAFTEAEALAREGLAMRRALLGEGHAEVAESMHDLSGLLYIKGDLPGAETLLRETLALDRKLHGNVHPVVAIDLDTLSQILTERGRAVEAEGYMRESYAIVQQIHPYEHRETAMTLRDLGNALVAQRRFSEGEALLREGLAIHQRMAGRRSEGVWHVLLRLGRARQAQGDLAGAEALYREYWDIGRALYGDDDARSARGMLAVAPVVRLQGRLDEAARLASQSIDLLRATLGAEHRTTAQAIEELAEVVRARGALPEAETHLREVVRIRHSVLPAGHPETGTALFRLGTVLSELGRAGEAADVLGQSLAIRRAALPAGDAAVAEVERALAQAAP